jgi:hypothetical protein
MRALLSGSTSVMVISFPWQDSARPDSGAAS